MSRWQNTSSRTKTGNHEYVLSESTYSINTSVKNVGNISNIETQKIYGKLDLSNAWAGNTNNTGLEIISATVNLVHPTDNTSTTRLSIQNGKSLMGYRNETDLSGAFIAGGPGEKVILYNRDSGDSQNNNIDISRALVIDNNGNIAIHAEQSSDISFDLFVNGNVRILGDLELDGSSNIVSHDEISGNIRVGRSLFVFGDDGTGTMTNSLGNTIDTNQVYNDHQLGSDYGELWVTNNATLFANLTVSGDIHTDASAVINGKLWVDQAPGPSSYSLIVGSGGLNVNNGDANIDGNILGQTITAYNNLHVSGDIHSNSNLTLDASAVIHGNLFVNSDITAQRLQVIGDVLNQSDVVINGTLDVSDVIHAGDSLIVDNNIIAYQNINVTGDIHTNSNLTVDASANIIGKLWVDQAPGPSSFSLIVGSGGINVNTGDAVIDGNILGQTITAYNNLNVTGTITVTGAGNINADGTVTAQSFNATSDVHLKENIVPINNSNALNLVSLFKPYEFNFKSDEHKRKRIGVIAQELEKISPELVIENDNGIKSVSYLDMIGLLIASVKELKERIEVLENKSS